MKQKEEKTINRLPDLKVLGCGYEHAAVIRNNCVYTMGVNAAGCLGTEKTDEKGGFRTNGFVFRHGAYANQYEWSSFGDYSTGSKSDRVIS